MFAILAVFALLPHTASASEASGTSEQFLGWSDDGKSWAVLWTNLGSGEEELWVQQQDRIALTLCTASESDMTAGAEGNECKPGKDTKAITLEVSRVNIETHKYLKPFRLKRVAKSWRTRFKKDYRISYTKHGKNWNDKRCAEAWAVTDRKSKKVVARHKVSKGCVRSFGGYLHPNGKFILVKQEHSTWGGGGEDDDFYTDDTVSLVFSELKRP